MRRTYPLHVALDIATASCKVAVLVLGVGLGGVAPAVAQALADSGAGGAAAPSAAPSTLAEVVVTAQKRAQNIQDVPIAVTALSGQQLADRGVVNTESLSFASPGVLISEPGQNPDQTFITIRGVTQLDFGLQQESPIALYIDGAYMGFESASGFGFYDVKDVQILRGPQGTLFGRNATGGLVQITTNAPTDYFTGYMQVGQGSYNEHKIEGALSGPLSKSVDARFSFLYNQQDGYINNTLGPSFGSDKTLSARLQFQYKPTENTKDLLQLSGARTFPIAAGVYFPFATAPNPGNHGLPEPNDGALFVQNCANLGYTVSPGATNCLGEHLNPRPWEISDPRIGFLKHTVVDVTNTLTHKMSWATLTGITNYTYFNQHYREDDSNGPAPIAAFQSGVNAYQASQELRLNGDTKKTHWVAGVYYLTIPGNYTMPILLGPFGNQFENPFVKAGPIFHQDVTTYALFGQGDYALTPKWRVTVGGRVEDDRKRLDLTNYCLPNPVNCAAGGTVTSEQFISGNIANVEWSGNFQLQYKPSDDLMFYGGIRRGTRDGELSVPQYPVPNQTFEDLVIQPEILTDTEAGFKSTTLGHRLRINGDVFYYHYHDYQAFKATGVSSTIFNAQARDYGAELSGTALVTPTVTAGVNLAYVHTKVMGVTLPDGSVSDNAQQPLAPRISGTVNLRKEWHESFGSLFAEVDGVYVGSRFFSTVNEPMLRAPAYWTGNVSLGYTTPDAKWTATLSVNNVNDKAYQTEIYDFTATAGYGEYNLAPPRWVLGQIRYNF